MSEALKRMTAAAREIRLLALDVDGILTDGSILLDDHGTETKRFNVRDGQGIASWRKLGYDVAIITKRSGQAVQHRCRELGIVRIVQGTQDKSAALDQLLTDTGLQAEQVAYMGDDWPDMAVLRRVGLSATVPDAPAAVRELAMYTTAAAGGRGAVREVIELILAAKGELERAIRAASASS